MKTIPELVLRARKVSTPLIAIECFDLEDTMRQIQNTLKGEGMTLEINSNETKEIVPVFSWDVVRGTLPRNDKAREVTIEEGIINPENAMREALKLPQGSVLFVLNAHRFIVGDNSDRNADFNQAIWNLRDKFKLNKRTLILLAPQIKLPLDLVNDVMVLKEELPSDLQICDLILKLTSESNVPIKFPTEVTKAAKALRGLPLFPAEQSIAMSLYKSGLKIDELWEKKNQRINDTKGLSVIKDTTKFKDIGGCDSVKKRLTRIMNGKNAPNVIVFIDEGEKMFAGSTHEIGDNTGVSQDILATTLKFMEDNEVEGAIFVGPPGVAKSAITKACHSEFDIPVIALDFGDLKSSGVGDTETGIRTAYETIRAVGDGKIFFILTCNESVSLPSALNRRFTAGTFFFDLPTEEETLNILKIYSKKYLDKEIDYVNQVKKSFANWTGAEIRNCFRIAYNENIGILEAMDYIIPVAKSKAKEIERLRKQASNNFLSANHRGAYEYKPKTEEELTERRMEIDD